MLEHCLHLRRKPWRVRAQALAQSSSPPGFILCQRHTWPHSFTHSCSGWLIRQMLLCDFNHCGLQPPLVCLSGGGAHHRKCPNMSPPVCIHKDHTVYSTFRSPTTTKLIEDGHRIHSFFPTFRRFWETGRRLLSVTK